MPTATIRTVLSSLIAAMAVAATISVARAQDAGQDVPAEVLFVISGGYWQGGEAGDDQDAADAPARGYYRLVVRRMKDNTSNVVVERIALGDDGPARIEATPVEAINTLPAYVTDVRPETSTGVADSEGFEAYVFLKPDPNAAEPETWVVFIDAFDELIAEPASN